MFYLWVSCEYFFSLAWIQTAKHSSCWKRSATRINFWTRQKTRLATWNAWWVMATMCDGLESSGRNTTDSYSPLCLSQVQDLEFAQIERKVIDGLKVGNDCLKKMHEVGDTLFFSLLWSSWKSSTWLCLLLQMMSIEEVERIMDETQDAIEYQRVRWMCWPSHGDVTAAGLSFCHSPALFVCPFTANRWDAGRILDTRRWRCHLGRAGWDHTGLSSAVRLSISNTLQCVGIRPYNAGKRCSCSTSTYNSCLILKKETW